MEVIFVGINFANSGEIREIKYPQSILRVQLEKIETAKKTQWFNDSRWFDDLQNPPTKKKNVISFLCREYLSLENIHQLSQLQLPTLYLFSPLDIRIYPKRFLIIVSYFFVSLKPYFPNVTFLY